MCVLYQILPPRRQAAPPAVALALTVCLTCAGVIWEWGENWPLGAYHTLK
jgi:hypothetical protein